MYEEGEGKMADERGARGEEDCLQDLDEDGMVFGELA